MFKKAFRYDDSIVFYFDQYDHKHVAKGGSLAWRLNNPGLVQSHSPLAKNSERLAHVSSMRFFHIRFLEMMRIEPGYANQNIATIL